MGESGTDSARGYITVVGMMALIALALILPFHRLGWIGEPRRRRG